MSQHSTSTTTRHMLPCWRWHQQNQQQRSHRHWHRHNQWRSTYMTYSSTWVTSLHTELKTSTAWSTPSISHQPVASGKKPQNSQTTERIVHSRLWEGKQHTRSTTPEFYLYVNFKDFLKHIDEKIIQTRTASTRTPHLNQAERGHPLETHWRWWNSRTWLSACSNTEALTMEDNASSLSKYHNVEVLLRTTHQHLGPQLRESLWPV